jgi:hypothetical protein
MDMYRCILWRIVGTFFLINLTPQAYCATARGLVIDPPSNVGEVNKSGEQEKVSKLIEIAIPKGAVKSQIDNAVAYIILDDSTSFSDTDTDDEEETPSLESGEEAIVNDQELNSFAVSKNTRSYNRSRHMPRGDKAAYKPRRNYLKTELQLNQLRVQLSQDAFDIVASEPNSRTKDSTVCFCVALRDKDGYVKKFAFHNGANVMSPAMRTKAHESGYDVIQVEQSHAEGQFLQFLLHRHKKRPGLYTHIMGMGCSRRHCAECNHILKRVLGSNYHAFTASVYDKKMNRVVHSQVQFQPIVNLAVRMKLTILMMFHLRKT